VLTPWRRGEVALIAGICDRGMRSLIGICWCGYLSSYFFSSHLFHGCVSHHFHALWFADRQPQLELANLIFWTNFLFFRMQGSQSVANRDVFALYTTRPREVPRIQHRRCPPCWEPCPYFQMAARMVQVISTGLGSTPRTDGTGLRSRSPIAGEVVQFPYFSRGERLESERADAWLDAICPKGQARPIPRVCGAVGFGVFFEQ